MVRLYYDGALDRDRVDFGLRRPGVEDVFFGKRQDLVIGKIEHGHILMKILRIVSQIPQNNRLPVQCRKWTHPSPTNASPSSAPPAREKPRSPGCWRRGWDCPASNSTRSTGSRTGRPPS